nr:hypothetical protein OH820_00710 [Streptomyces sp. NBC_00857]
MPVRVIAYQVRRVVAVESWVTSDMVAGPGRRAGSRSIRSWRRVVRGAVGQL